MGQTRQTLATDFFDGEPDRFATEIQFGVVYCISDGFDDKATIVEAMELATNEWSEAAGIGFIYDPTLDAGCDTYPSGAKIRVVPNVGAPQGGAFAGPPRFADQILGINCGTCNPTCGAPCVNTLGVDYNRRLLLHEVGHLMGFRHEWERTDSPVCGDTATGVTRYDPESAVHYVIGNSCAGTAVQTYITDLDRLGAQSIYGIPWEGLGGAIVGNPAVASWEEGRLDVFVRGTDNQLHHRWFDDGTWHDFESLGGVLTSPPAAVSWGPGRIDVVARGADNQLHHIWFDGQWHPWESLGGVLGDGAPAITSWNPGRLDVFVRGADDQLHHRWFDGQWHAFESLGGVITSGPGAVSWQPGRIDVFARGTDGHLHQRWFNGTWQPWAFIGSPGLTGVATDAPAVTSWTDSHLDVFARGTDDTLYRLRYMNGWSSEWVGLGGILASGPGAVNWGPGRSDVFVADLGGGTAHGWFENSLWRQCNFTPCDFLSNGGTLRGTIAVTDEWNTGYCATLTVKNNTTSTMTGFRALVDAGQGFPYQYWNADVTSVGTTYNDYRFSSNATLPAGGVTANIGYCATKAGTEYHPLVVTVSSCTDGVLNDGETALDCGGPCGATCGTGQPCNSNGDCSSGSCVAGVCEAPPSGGCVEANAVDLGAPGNNVTVPNDGCVRVRDGFPSWWGVRTLKLENPSGSYPVPFTWSSSCTGGSGSGSFTSNWQPKFLPGISASCATVIDLGGSGAGNITLRYWAN